MYCVYVDDIVEYNKWLEGGELTEHFAAALESVLRNLLNCSRITLTFVIPIRIPMQHADT